MRKQALASLLVLFGMLACADPAPEIGSLDFSKLSLSTSLSADSAARRSEPFRAIYGLSAMEFEVTVPEARVRHFRWRYLFMEEKETTVLSASWSEQLAARLQVELYAAAGRAGITTMSREELPACPQDGPATVGRTFVELLEIQALPVPDLAPDARPGGQLLRVMMRVRLRLTDNCDRELKSAIYGTDVGLIKTSSVDDFLASWLSQQGSTDTAQDASRVALPFLPAPAMPGYQNVQAETIVKLDNPTWLAEAIVTSGLLVWMPAWPPTEALEKRSTPFTLRAIAPADALTFFHSEKDEAPLMDSDLRLRWESMQELLAALGPAELSSRMSDVRYELVVYRARPASKGAAKSQVFHATDLTSTEWDGSEALEPCESFGWSVRAFFRLDGFPRTTAWSGVHNAPGYLVWPQLTWPGSGLHRFRTPPPAGFTECH